MALKMDVEALTAFLTAEFGQVTQDFVVLDVTPDHLRLRLVVGQ